MSPRQRIALGMILLLALIIRISMILHTNQRDPSLFIEVDSASYEIPAIKLLETGRFLSGAGEPELNRTPGYPLMIAGLYALAGRDPLNVVLFQALLSIGTIWLLFRMALPRWGINVALLAAALLALDLASTLYIGRMLTETLFTFLLLLMIWAGLRLIDTDLRPAWPAFLMGLFLAMATHVRPLVFYLVIPLLVGFALHFLLKRQNWRAIAVKCGLILLPWVLLVGGWELRNALFCGQFTLCTMEKSHMMISRAIDLEAHRQEVSYEEAERRFHASLPDMHAWPTEKAQAFELERAQQLMRRNWKILAGNTIKSGLMLYAPSASGLRQFFNLPSSLGAVQLLHEMRQLPLRQGFLQWRNWIPLVLSMSVSFYLLLIYSCSLLALVRTGQGSRANWAIDLFLLGIVLYFTTLTALSGWGYERYRVPMMPILALWGARGLAFVCFGIQNILTRFRHDKTGMA